jgi:predicted CxxxxCH...CXXCH cytochrome family protein
VLPFLSRSWFSLVAVTLILGCARQSLTDGLPDTLDCASCHGSTINYAPPHAVDGATNTSDIRVGAHQSHLLGGTVAGPVACVECHPIPTDMANHPSVEGGPAHMTFGTFASRAGAVPVWDRGTARCTNTYCHGATLRGAETRQGPLWTQVDGSQLTCTSCHGNPPSGTHTTNTQCEACHGEVVAAGGVIIAPLRHIDGIVDVGGGGGTTHPAGYADPLLHGADTNQGKSNCKACHGSDLTGGSSGVGCDTCHASGWRTNCTFCHGGTLDTTGAPPVDIFGNTATTTVGVGSHSTHVSRTTHPAYACSVCHPPVTDVLTSGHLFEATAGRSEVSFTGAPGGTGKYAAPSCSDIYCHGNGITNGTAASFVPGAPLGCTSCHPAATQSSGHSLHTAYGCETCHATVVSSASVVTEPELHVNGSVEVSLPAGTWDPQIRSCTNTTCHGAESSTW